MIPVFLTFGLTIMSSGIAIGVSLYVKHVVMESIKNHLSEFLPGLFAVEFAKWQDKADIRYATVIEVRELRTRLDLIPLTIKGLP